MAEPGRRLLGGRYELDTLLATGGQGQVWRGRDTVLSRPVAVKVLRSEFTGDATFLARFRAEAQHAALVAHRHIAALYDYGELDDALTGERLAFLVMELVVGESLADLLAREGRLPAPRTLAILRQAADALAAAHAAGLVHRDVKPGNVLVAADGAVKLTDFGIAVSASSLPLTQTGHLVGTAHYISPEQAAGSRAAAASDVYALGLVGYECLAGRRAFEGENSVQIALSHLRDTPDPLPDDVPEQVRVLIQRATVRDPARRLPDGGAFRDAIDDVLGGRQLAPAPPDTSPLPTGPLAGRAPRRARALAPLAALLVGAGLGVGALQLALDPAPAPAARETATAGTVLLVAADHLGRPVAEVEADLGRLGLRVERVADAAADGAAGTVTALGPSGALERGTLVRVTYATGRPEVAVEDGPVVSDVTSEAPASPAPAAPPAVTGGPAAVAPAPPAPTPSTQQPTAEPPAPSNGNGNGKANGNGNGEGERERQGERERRGQGERGPRQGLRAGRPRDQLRRAGPVHSAPPRQARAAVSRKPRSLATTGRTTSTQKTASPTIPPAAMRQAVPAPIRRPPGSSGAAAARPSTVETVAKADHSGMSDQNDSPPKRSARPASSRTRDASSSPSTSSDDRSGVARRDGSSAASGEGAGPVTRESGHAVAGPASCGGGSGAGDGAAGPVAVAPASEGGGVPGRPGTKCTGPVVCTVGTGAGWAAAGCGGSWGAGAAGPGAAGAVAGDAGTSGATIGISRVLGGAGSGGSAGVWGSVGELTGPPSQRTAGRAAGRSRNRIRRRSAGGPGTPAAAVLGSAG